MADIISLQELADAKLDAQSLERFINGGVDEEVLTRLSQQYPTMQNFLLQFQKHNSRAYKTYALMDADKANIPAKSKVTVTNDAIDSNNGDWQWDGVVFTKSAYDPLTQAKAYTDNLETSRQYYTNSAFSVTDFYVASATGLLVANIDFNSTDFIQVEPNTAYKFNVDTGASSGCAFYDSDKKYISGFGNSGVAGTNYTVTTPNNARYVRLSNRKTNSTPYFRVDGRYNIIKILSIVNSFPPTIPLKNIPVGADNLAQELVRLNDPMHSEKVVISKEQLNTVNTNGLSDRAYPIGRRVYDHSLRREVIADGSFWRLPDGRPASLEPRVYVYPDWDEIRAALPIYASAYKKVFDASALTGWGKQTVADQTVDFALSTEKGFKSICIEHSAGGNAPYVYFDNATAIGLNSYLIFKMFVDFNTTWQVTIGLFNSSGILLFNKVIQTNAMGTNPRSFYTLDTVRVEQKVSDFSTVVAGASLNDVTRIGFKVDRKAGLTAKAWVGELETVSFKPMITLRFDDQRQSVYTNAYPIMQQYGFNGVIAVITGAPELANDPNVHYPLVGMTKAQLLDVRAAGWDLVSHTHTHPEYETKTDEYMRDDYRKSVNYLRSDLNAGDIASSCLVSPYNRRSERIAQVQREFYDCQINQSQINSHMPRQPEGTWQTGSLWTSMGSADGDRISDSNILIGYAQAAINQQRWQTIMFHDILPTVSNSNATTIQAFTEFCTWLDAHRNEIDVVTVGDVVRKIRP